MQRSMFQPSLSRSRTIAAAGIVAASTLLSACGTDQTGLGINLVPEAQVEQMGVESWQALRSETPASNDSNHQRIARNIANRILSAAGKDPAAWDVVVFADDQANAFALPGQKIGVYEGMFNVAANEAQLAAVIGHEVAHVEARHATERVNTEAATQLGVQLVSTVLGTADASSGAVAALAGMGAQYGIAMPYSRNQELEADRLGLTYMARAGYDPAEAIALWRNMAQQPGSRPPAFLSTHPAPDQRIAQLERLMPEARQIYIANR